MRCAETDFHACKISESECAAQWRHQHMNVVGHHHKISQQILRAFIVLQRVFNCLPAIPGGPADIRRGTRPATAPSDWKTLVIFLFRFVVPRFWMRLQPRGAFRQPRLHPRFRQRIRRAPGDEIRRPILPPMRQTGATQMPHRSFGIEADKRLRRQRWLHAPVAELPAARALLPPCGDEASPPPSIAADTAASFFSKSGIFPYWISAATCSNPLCAAPAPIPSSPAPIATAQC